MTEMDNFSAINENFDTIKTLLNSIRAQGILNTSDVDKLLSGINAKLEKINTDEDIDLIKIFLSELKQNLDERHSILVSKFGAIESLFSNLLKNSSELPKSSDIKELFDIVATNLSVFSREVVSQKESLTEISLRLEALRSDDSSKKDIIKNITLLKPDLERLNNGFDSIVISLNDNFKTIVKTISTIDKTEYLEKFSDILSNIEMSSNTILSALQVLDKKNEQIDSAIKELVTKEDIQYSNKHLLELNAQAQDIQVSLAEISKKQVKIDNLSEKIDASVSIIVGLKSAIEESDSRLSENILEQLSGLELELSKISTDNKFEEFKNSLEEVLNGILEKCSFLEKDKIASSQEIQNIVDLVESLGININFQHVMTSISKLEEDVKNSIYDASHKIVDMQDANTTRVINDLTTGVESLSSKLGQTQSSILVLCEKNFSSVFESVIDLKKLLAQIDESSVSANNAIFSNLSDRLLIFENQLNSSLENQEKSLKETSSNVIEQIENIKNIANLLDYKMDSSILEITNVKKDFTPLQKAIEEVLALDFVNKVKDLRVDLYASKQEIVDNIENSNGDLVKTLSNDLYAKYELLISKLDKVEDDFKNTQSVALLDLKNILEKISNSIIDIISYVSESNNDGNDLLDSRITEIKEILDSNSLNYIENIRDIVELVKIQVENNLKTFEEDNVKNMGLIKDSIVETSNEIKNEIKYSYSKLLEIQDINAEFKELLNVNEINFSNKVNDLILSTSNANQNFEDKLSNLKLALLEKISEFKQEFTCENADKINEIRFLVENFSNKNSKDISDLLEDLKEQIKNYSNISDEKNKDSLDVIINNFATLKNAFSNFDNNNQKLLNEHFDSVMADFEVLRGIISGLDESLDEDLTRQMSIIESNFESLVSQITIIFDKSEKTLFEKVDDKFSSVVDTLQSEMALKLEDYKLLIENSIDKFGLKSTEQTEKVNNYLNTISSEISSIFEKQIDENNKLINELTVDIKNTLDENVKLTAVDYIALKNKLSEFAQCIENSTLNLDQNLKVEFSNIFSELNECFGNQKETSEEYYQYLRNSIEERTDLIAENINSINFSLTKNEEHLQTALSKLSDLTEQGNANKVLVENLAKVSSEQVDILQATIEEKASITSENLDTLKTSLMNNEEANQAIITDITNLLKLNDKNNIALEDFKSTSLKQNEEICNLLNINKTLIDECNNSFENKIQNLTLAIASNSKEELDSINSYIDRIENQISIQQEKFLNYKNSITDLLKNEINLISNNIEKETDVLINELIEQFELLKKSQADIIVNVTTQVDDIISSHIYNNIEDLKSYLDVKTDNSILTSKLDNLKTEFSSSIQEMFEYLNKLLVSDAFLTTISDYRTANELFITSTIDKLNDKFDKALSENEKNIKDTFALFDKKFIDIIVDKYEEIKIVTNEYNKTFNSIEDSISKILYDFKNIQEFISNEIKNLSEVIKNASLSTNEQVKILQESFDNLRSQISNKSFDEAFQASINKQIAELESLINEQFDYIKDINDLCSNNLPDVAELTLLVKHSVIESIKKLSEKLDSSEIEELIGSTKTDIITQMINVFNQISFVAEEEEILDFIHEKHAELISILSHLVTNTENIVDIKDNVSLINSKVDSLKEDLSLINDKISQIISAEDEVDYIYSLQELETDIAGLRIALNEINNHNNAKELSELISSTNEIYNLVEAIKSEFPNKSNFDNLTSDLESISSRTNKLILASDESYKILQDNLQDFKLVINDIDDRTRHFSQEVGIDKINTKLNAINSMMQDGAKSNKIFNQIFEYLAEWVDNAGNQINSISNKIENLDEISQIKFMLEDIKSNSNDNTETTELIETLGDIFGKQVKRISSLETKLDKIIVETTLNNQNNKVDLKPMEEILNRFLVTIDEKMTKQQLKINSLEEKLSEVMGLLDEKDTAQLSKKVGGMDRQIAKLNKSIEKIASHVVEK